MVGMQVGQQHVGIFLPHVQLPQAAASARLHGPAGAGIDEKDRSFPIIT
jgi:hypothetical protein